MSCLAEVHSRGNASEIEKIPKWECGCESQAAVWGCEGGQTGFPNLWLNI